MLAGGRLARGLPGGDLIVVAGTGERIRGTTGVDTVDPKLDRALSGSRLLGAELRPLCGCCHFALAAGAGPIAITATGVVLVAVGVVGRAELAPRLVLRTRGRPPSLRSPAVGSVASAGAPVRLDRPNVPVGVLARGLPRSSFSDVGLRSWATTGFSARLLAVIRAGLPSPEEPTFTSMEDATGAGLYRRTGATGATTSVCALSLNWRSVSAVSGVGDAGDGDSTERGDRLNRSDTRSFSGNSTSGSCDPDFGRSAAAASSALLSLPCGESTLGVTALGMPVGVRDLGRCSGVLVLGAAVSLLDAAGAELGVVGSAPLLSDCRGRARWVLALRLPLPGIWLCSASVNGLYLLLGSTATAVVASCACFGDGGFCGGITTSTCSEVVRRKASGLVSWAACSAGGRIRCRGPR